MKFNIYTVFSSIILILLSGCYDDFVPYSEVGEGMAEISAEVTFEPLTGIINNTRSEGNIIKTIPNILENFIKFATIGTNPPILT